jgi:LruC domain-containing protein
MKKLSLLALALSASVQATDYQYVGDPATGYTANGKPLGVVNTNGDLPANILDNIYSMLPESTVVNPAFIAPDTLSNISIDDDLLTYAEVTVTFLNEGAGYRNSLGYFIYESNNPPTSKEDIAEHKIIFPNASKPDAGSMLQGDTVDLGIQLLAGQTIGFFVVPNGWGYNGSGSNIKNDGPWHQPFYSLEALNPEPLSLRRHNVVFIDPVSELLVIGFDDQYMSTGDEDFNDLLFSVAVSPFVAIEGVNEDGSVDGGFIPLEQSSDENGDIISYYPSKNGFATMMYEDLWPLIGDYDFNDVVMQYRMKRTLGGQNSLKRLESTYTVQAQGAGYSNGYSLHLPGVAKSNIASVSLTKNGVPVSHEIIEGPASETILVISSNIKDDIVSSCEFFRTLTSCKEDINLSYDLDVSFVTPVPLSVIGQPPYDPFLFAATRTYHGSSFFGVRPERSWELHQKHFAGTSLFNPAYYNLEADTSSAPFYFINANNMPWVINITDTFSHPAENQDISVVYPEFTQWIDAGGFAFTDWYLRSKADTSKLYE